MNKMTAIKERVERLSELVELMDEINDNLIMEKKYRELYGAHYDQEKKKEVDDLIDQYEFQLKANYNTLIGICEVIKEVVHL
jgi:hypothetical protein